MGAHADLEPGVAVVAKPSLPRQVPFGLRLCPRVALGRNVRPVMGDDAPALGDKLAVTCGAV